MNETGDSRFKGYQKKGTQLMRPYISGEDLSRVSVSPEDTPEEGGMIAINRDNPSDQWYVAKDFFEKNYEEEFQPECSESDVYREPVNMSFGEALEQMKEFGRRVARKGWNGKGMFIEICDAEGPYTLYDGKVCGRRPYIYMKTADDMLVPWTASQTDVLAEDWEVVG